MVTVSNPTHSVTVTATPVSSDATFTINGGSANSVALAVGTNTITIDVRHTLNGTTDTKTYTIVVTRLDEAPFLSSLSIDGVKLDPTFSSSVFSYYGSVNDSVDSVTITATATTDATITYNDSINNTTPLAMGDNVINVKVTNSSGTRTYRITLTKTVAPSEYESSLTTPTTLTLQVAESVNGTKLGNVAVKLFDASNNQFLVQYTTDADGMVQVKAAPNATINIVTTKGGYATTRAQGIVADTAKSLTIINQKLGMVTKPASAPTLVALEMYDNNFSSHAAITNTVDLTIYTYLVATFASVNAIEATAWSGFGAKLGIDINPDTFNGIDGILINQVKNGQGNYERSNFRCREFLKHSEYSI
ncbi:MAG TPA: cadherin-like beta sandwich domain-containing protein [Spirochaetales bacterium]|nr:cadherin-like beta sandwich domain-containing protein [Spirochaetales bacterium]